ncbi:MAG: glycosyltransferase family 39 protein [Anaerolineae bacterium]
MVCYTKHVKTCFNTFSVADTEFIRWTIQRPPRWAGLLLTILLLAGCATRPDLTQPRHSQTAGEIWGEQTVGQTFIAEKDGLNRIDVFLATYARDNAGPVIFHLRESTITTQDLATIRFDAADVQDNAYRQFTFPPLGDSENHAYYFFFEAPEARPGNAITVWASPTDTYSQGQAYLAGQPQAGDLAFRTYADYNLVQIGRDLWRGLRRHASAALLAVILFVVPGAGVLALCGGVLGIGYWVLEIRDWRLEIGDWELVIMAAGLSVAIAPLLILFASLAGLTLNQGPVIALLILCAILAVLPTLHQHRFPISNTQYPIPNTQYPIPPILLLLIFLISLATRLLLVQDLVAPMWGDSYHHTLIAQLLVNHGGLFQSWEPYAPLQSFTYHFGFHSNVALFHWLTGTPVLKSVIIVGQILNALAPLMIYPLVRRLGGSEWAGLTAVLIASLLSPMPAGYVNWGRYTQLTGMIVLPVAATLTIDAVSSKDRSWRQLILAGIAVAGLALSHYLVTLLFVPFVLAYLLWWSSTRIQRLCGGAEEQRSGGAREQGSPLPPSPRFGRGGSGGRGPAESRSLGSEIAQPWLRAGTVGVTAGLLISPWILNLRTGYLPRVLAGRFGGGAGTAYFQTTYNAVGDLFAYVPPWLIALAVAGALWSGWQRRPLAIVTNLWTALLILITNPNLIGLPGAGVVNNFMLQIALYLPLSMLASAGVGDLIERIVGTQENIEGRGMTTKACPEVPPEAWSGPGRDEGPGRRIVTTNVRQIIVATLIIVAALAGARWRLMDLDYRYRLVTPADMEAMQWIRDNTPADAKFLVNSLTAFGGHTIVGDDAGWWIPYFTGRRTMVPPATYGMETSDILNYPGQVEAFYRNITTHPLDSPRAADVLRAQGITHIYIGAAGNGLLDPAILRQSPFYYPVYDRDGAMIFQVTQ